MEEKKRLIVLTGGPCSGKSTLINEFKRRGESVLEETAREIIAEGFLEEGKGYNNFQKEILIRQKKKEDSLPYGIHFLDRSIIDGLAYSKIYLGKVIPELSVLDFSNRYENIFILDRMPLEKDGMRVESDDREAEKVHSEIEKAYLETGYKPIRVPFFSKEKSESVKLRADFIMNACGVNYAY